MMGWRVAPLPAMAVLLLVAVNLVLLAMIAAPIIGDDGVPRPKVEWPGKSPGSATDAFFVPKPLDAYRLTLSQPVFFKTRVPFVPPPPKPAVAASAASMAPQAVADPGFVLGGIVVRGGVKKVYLTSKSDARGAWVAEGESVLGWKVQSVDGAGAKLGNGSRVLELLLYPAR